MRSAEKNLRWGASRRKGEEEEAAAGSAAGHRAWMQQLQYTLIGLRCSAYVTCAHALLLASGFRFGAKTIESCSAGAIE